MERRTLNKDAAAVQVEERDGHTAVITGHAAVFFRKGGPCEDCLGKRFPWPGIVHACYRRSRPASATVAVMLAVHKSLQTFSERVDLYVALTGFGRCVICGDILSNAPLKYRRSIMGFTNPYAGFGMLIGGLGTLFCILTFSVFGLWFTLPLCAAALRFRHQSL